MRERIEAPIGAIRPGRVFILRMPANPSEHIAAPASNLSRVLSQPDGNFLVFQAPAASKIIAALPCCKGPLLPF